MPATFGIACEKTDIAGMARSYGHERTPALRRQ
jgi:hypothetical protein